MDEGKVHCMFEGPGSNRLMGVLFARFCNGCIEARHGTRVLDDVLVIKGDKSIRHSQRVHQQEHTERQNAFSPSNLFKSKVQSGSKGDWNND